MAKQQQNAAKAKAVLTLDEDLDSLFAEALAATETRTKKKSPAAPPAPAVDEDGFFDLDDLDDPDGDADRSMHFMVDDEPSADQSSDDEPNHGPEFSLDDLDFLQSDPPPASAKPKPKVKSTIDDLDVELRAALGDDDDDDDDTLQREMEKLLAQSFAGTVSDSDPDLGFPEIDDDDDDEEILAMGDDSAPDPGAEARDEVVRYRNQIGELSRLLSMRDLELRTVEDHSETLESQLVASARQSANVGREFESFRKRSERERADLEKFAGEKVIKEFLGVYDNLSRALEHAGDQRNSPLGEGVDMILGQFRGALKRCGVEAVESVAGVEFDPTFHEAVGQEFSADIPTGGIVTEMAAGFTLSGRLLRAAMVTVSQGPLPSAAPPPEEAPSEAPKAEAKAKAPKRTKKTGKKKTGKKKAPAKAPTDE